MASSFRSAAAQSARRGRIAGLSLVAALALVLAACNAGPAPVRFAAPEGPPPDFVEVLRGDTVLSVATRHDVAVDDVIALNGLTPPYTLRRGQLLRVPVPQDHVVASGESLSVIAEAYRIDQSDLAAANNLAPPYTLQPGQRLTLPPRRTPVIASAESYRVVTPSRIPPQAASVEPTSLGPGEDIGFEPPPSGSTAVTVETLDPLDPQSADPAAGAAADPVAQLPREDQPSAPGAPLQLAPQGPATVETAPPPGGEPDAEVAALPPAAPPQAPPIAGPLPRGDRFGWPLVGEIVSEFGPKPDGTHNDGINIAAARGATVAAADDGVVAYAGNELRGYGNLLLIRHDGDWVTAYAHLDELLVQRGDRIRVGQAIATVGSSGTVAAPQLHFEIRQGTEAVDPANLLPPLSR